MNLAAAIRTGWGKVAVVGIGLLGLIVAVVALSSWGLSEEKPASPGEVRQSFVPHETGIAVVDMTEVLQRIPELRAELMTLQSDMQRAQGQFQKRQADLLAMQKELQSLAPGSAEFQQRQQALQQELSQLQTELQLQQQEFFGRERQAYTQASARVEKAVQKVAQDRGIKLVLRKSRTPGATANPQELMGYLSREVVWADSQLDITEEVIKAVLGE